MMLENMPRTALAGKARWIESLRAAGGGRINTPTAENNVENKSTII
jgi:hypothetical protein